MKCRKQSMKATLGAVLLAAVMSLVPPLAADNGGQSLMSLLPKEEGWAESESAEIYVPANLYEFINGAAEIYLSYDFLELVVAQFRHAEGGDMSVEIYDMGNPENAFGIYSAERFPENNFISVGVQGYHESDTLNFLAGKYYVKLLCFDRGEDSGSSLMGFARAISSRIGGRPSFPALVDVFPRPGLIVNSEKFVLRNFMGYAFLSRGYIASYFRDETHFDAFLIDGGNEEDAEAMLLQFLEKKNEQPFETLSGGYRIEDRYAANVFIGRSGRYIYGATRVARGKEGVGAEFFLSFGESLESISR